MCQKLMFSLSLELPAHDNQRSLQESSIARAKPLHAELNGADLLTMAYTCTQAASCSAWRGVCRLHFSPLQSSVLWINQFGRLYVQKCCKRFISGQAQPETAEQLMRARFSAYCSKSTDFICNTTHPENSAFGGTMADGQQSSTFKVRLRVFCTHA